MILVEIASAEGFLSVVQYLVMQGANVNAIDRWQHTPLNEAIQYNHTAIATFLKDHGAIEGKMYSSYPNQQAESLSQSIQTNSQPAQKIRVSAYILNSNNGKVVSFPIDATMEAFFQILQQKFGKPVKRITNKLGAEIDSLDTIQPDDVIYLEFLPDQTS